MRTRQEGAVILHKEFLETAQRPFPLPRGPWVMTQTWYDLLFSHWQVPETLLRAHIPSILDIDLFEGTAWVGIIPFKVNHMRMRGLPEMPFLHSYLELNVRTYVTYKGTPGIYFFSLDADKLLAVLAAKIGSLLPYRLASMNMESKGDLVHFRSNVKHAVNQKEILDISYHSISEPFLPAEDSLEYWLYERYCFLTVKGNHLYRGDIHHDRWRVSKAQADIHINSMASFLQPHYFEPEPLLHICPEKQVFAWMLEKLE